MVLQEVLHPGHVAAAAVKDGADVGVAGENLAQRVHGQPRHGVPGVRAGAAEGAEAAEEVGGVDRGEGVELVLQGDHVRPPLRGHMEVALEGQDYGQLQLLEITLDHARMLLDARHLVVSRRALIAGLEVLVFDDAGVLHDHVLPDLVADVAPRLHLLARHLHLVPHDEVVGDGEDLLALWALVNDHRQALRGEEVLAHCGVHEAQGLESLRLICNGDVEALPEAPLTVELLEQGRVTGDLPHAHHEEHVHASLGLVHRVLVPLPARVRALPEDDNLLSVVSCRGKGVNAPPAKMDLPEPRSSVVTEGGKGKIAQPPLGWLLALFHLRDLGASVNVALVVHDLRGVDHELEVRGQHGCRSKLAGGAARPVLYYARTLGAAPAA
mmetsp:Transcript_123892/g.361823  ORF Transcript_123892/g.361823 Transcript_123892/m.361823 type:complete len:383 (-) Transcript_123892:8-1156(-)